MAGGGGTEIARSVPPGALSVGRGDMNIADVALRIVRSKDLVGHEEVDRSRVQRLVRRLQSDGVLRNPPVVAAAGSQYVVLDGITRVAALRELGIQDVVVQIVDYDRPGIELHSWCHVVVGMPAEELLEKMLACEGLRIQSADMDSAVADLRGRKLLSYLVLRDGGVVAVAGGAGVEAEVSLLNEMVSVYRNRAQVYRVLYEGMDVLVEEYPELSAIAVFPCYTCEEILRAALNGARLPMGVTRHAISGRVLGLNVDLVMLDSDIPLEQKNVWLRDLIRSKIKNKRVRFYPESVFRFDE
jgi:hypothetical protein